MTITECVNRLNDYFGDTIRFTAVEARDLSTNILVSGYVLTKVHKGQARAAAEAFYFPVLDQVIVTFRLFCAFHLLGDACIYFGAEYILRFVPVTIPPLAFVHHYGAYVVLIGLTLQGLFEIWENRHS